MSSGLYSHTTRATGTVLTAAIYNSDHQNHITNADPSMIGALSDDLTEYQSTADPGGVGSEALAGSLAEELQRIRFALKRILGEAQWYAAPSVDLASVGDVSISSLSSELIPATITADTNNYAPTGHAAANMWYLTTDVARSLTGIAGGVQDRVLGIHVLGTEPLILKAQDANSDAANRLAIGRDVTIGAGGGAVLIYSATDDRWHILGLYAREHSQAEAEAGVSQSGYMTALRTKQAIAALTTISLVVAKTANHTLALADAGKIVEMSAAGATQVLIPTDAAVAFPTNTYVNVVRYGAGAVTIKGDTGVTVNGVSAGTVTIDDQYGGVTIYKRGTNEWVVPNGIAV